MGEDDSQKQVQVNQVNIVDPMTGAYEVLNDVTVGKYDVRVTVGPSYATRRIEAADSMMQFIQAFPAAAPIAGDLIAKSMDWPGAEEIAERLKKALPPEMLDEEMSPEEMAQKQQQIEQAQQREEEAYQIEKATKVADIRAKMAKAAKDMADTEAQELENDAVESGLSEMLGQADG